MFGIKHSVIIATLCLAGVAPGLAAAQPKPEPAKPAKPAAAKPVAPAQDTASCEDCKAGCPMYALGDLADAKVENGAKGATITFTAKKPEDAQKVQELAKQLADRAGCECCMHGKGGHECKMEDGKCEKCEHHGHKHDDMRGKGGMGGKGGMMGPGKMQGPAQAK